MKRIIRGEEKVFDPQYINQGKTLPGVEFEYYDEDNTAIDLSEAILEFVWREFDIDNDQFIDRTAVNTPTGTEEGVLSYVFDPEDTAETGLFYGQFSICYSDGSVELVPKFDGQPIVIF